MKGRLAVKWKEFWFTVTLILLLAISSWLAQCTVRTGRIKVDPLSDPSPFGYTVSLGLFFFPIVVLGAWLWRARRHDVAWRAFWKTIYILVPVGFILDIFFGPTFLEF